MKKLGLLAVSLLLIVSLLAGCGDETKSPKEILEGGIKNSADIKTYKSSTNLNFSLNIPTEDEMQAMFLQMFNEGNLDMEFTLDSDNQKLSGEATVGFGGMTYNISLYQNKDKFIMRIPMVPQYIVQEIEEQESNEELVNLGKEVIEDLLGKINEENLEDRGKKTITIKEEDIEGREIALSFTDKEAKSIIKDIMKKVFDSKSMEEYMKDSLRSNLEIQGITPSEEDIDKAYSEMKTVYSEGLIEFEESVNVDKLNIIYFIDNKDNIRTSNYEISLSGEDEVTKEEISIDINLKSEVWNINKSVEIDIPEVNEENSITMDEFGSPLNGPLQPRGL